MRSLCLLALAACGHTAAIEWTRVPIGSAKNLTSVACTPGGDVYAIDDAGDVHDLRGHAPRPAPDPMKTTAAQTKLPGSVDYGRAQIEAVARDRQHVYALGRYMAISNSLENDYAYLLRSDDEGATWAVVWTGPDQGPMGMGRGDGSDVGDALAVIPAGVVLAATDGAVLISSDLGKTFVRHAAASAPLAALWATPTGRLFGVGHRGEIVFSTDGGKTFQSRTLGPQPGAEG